MDRYCTICDTLIEHGQNESGMVYDVCRTCSRIEHGYEAHEKNLVLALRNILSGEMYTVYNVLVAVRKHVNDIIKTDVK